jgi:hypothetical protein
MKSQPQEPEQHPKPPQVREGGYTSQCHNAECLSVPFYAEDAQGRRLDKICEVIQCHAYVPKTFTDPDDEGRTHTQTRACLEPQGVVRSRRDKSFGISTKTICDLARKGIFGVCITKKETAPPKFGIERALPDEP